MMMRALLVLPSLMMSGTLWAATVARQQIYNVNIPTAGSTATPAPLPNLKPSRMVAGHYVVTRVWFEKGADGNLKYDSDQVCKVDTPMPFYTFNTSTPNSNIDPKDINLGECKTALHTGEPVSIAIFGLLGSGMDSSTGSLETVFSGSYGFSQSPDGRAGGFSVFTTRTSLKDGSFIIPSQTSVSTPGTIFSVTLSFEDQP
jgi:hypothetical protein